MDEIEAGVNLDDVDEETENEMDGAAVDELVITDSQEFLLGLDRIVALFYSVLKILETQFVNVQHHIITKY